MSFFKAFFVQSPMVRWAPISVPERFSVRIDLPSYKETRPDGFSQPSNLPFKDFKEADFINTVYYWLRYLIHIQNIDLKSGDDIFKAIKSKKLSKAAETQLKAFFESCSFRVTTGEDVNESIYIKPVSIDSILSVLHYCFAQFHYSEAAGMYYNEFTNALKAKAAVKKPILNEIQTTHVNACLWHLRKVLEHKEHFPSVLIPGIEILADIYKTMTELIYNVINFYTIDSMTPHVLSASLLRSIVSISHPAFKSNSMVTFNKPTIKNDLLILLCESVVEVKKNTKVQLEGEFSSYTLENIETIKAHFEQIDKRSSIEQNAQMDIFFSNLQRYIARLDGTDPFVDSNLAVVLAIYTNTVFIKVK